MADPISAGLALVGTASTIAGGVMGAKGAEKQGIAQLQQNYYQAGVADLNSKIAKQNADFALNQGEQEAFRRGLTGGEQISAIKTAQASSGLDVNTGSAVRVREGQKQIVDLDMTQARSNAAKVAYDYDVQSLNFEKQAGLYRMAGTNAAQAGQIKAETSLIGTVGSVASKWAQGNQLGFFGGGAGGGGQALGD